MTAATLLLAGDVMTGRGVDQVLPHPGAPWLVEHYVRDARDYVRLAESVNGTVPAPVTPDYVWGEALAPMRRAQLRIVNLETAITARDEPWPRKGIHYRMHPANIECLTVAGIDACSLANNHVLDWGRDGLADTLATLATARIAAAGAGASLAQAWAPAILPLHGGGRLLLYAVACPSSGVPAAWSAGPRRPGIALLEPSEDAAQQLAAAVAAARQRGDLVLLSIHWGGNWGFELPEQNRRFAHRLVDLGAVDIVHGHSSHHPLPAEVYRGKLVLYGCGDLINDYEGIDTHSGFPTDVGALYFVTVERASGELRSLEILPLQRRRFRLEHADAPARRWLEQAFDRHGAALGTRVRPAPAGRLALAWETVHSATG